MLFSRSRFDGIPPYNSKMLVALGVSCKMLYNYLILVISTRDRN